MAWELIAVGTGVFTACLVVGVQLIFYTRHFEEEYGSKVEKITLITNWKLDKELIRLCKSKFGREEIPEEFREWTSVFPETLEDIRFKDESEVEVFPEYVLEEGYFELVSLKELDTIVDTVSDLKRWYECITDGKTQLRGVGKNLIYLGIIAFAGSIVYSIFPEPLAIFLFLYIGTIPVVRLTSHSKNHWRTMKKIDETHKKVQKRSLDL